MGDLDTEKIDLSSEAAREAYLDTNAETFAIYLRTGVGEDVARTAVIDRAASIQLEEDRLNLLSDLEDPNLEPFEKANIQSVLRITEDATARLIISMLVDRPLQYANYPVAAKLLDKNEGDFYSTLGPYGPASRMDFMDHLNTRLLPALSQSLTAEEKHAMSSRVFRNQKPHDFTATRPVQKSGAPTGSR